MELVSSREINVVDIISAQQLLKDIIIHTPLQKNEELSKKYKCQVFLKREDLQVVRSFKIRGAYYKIKKMEKDARRNGVVCASAGNHAQGVAYTCSLLEINAHIFMPLTTPTQKINQVRMFGKEFIEIVLCGDTFDEASKMAQQFAIENDAIFIHPFDDIDIISGQGTVGVEIMNDMEKNVDYIFCGVGGGGLISGISTFVKHISPSTNIVGVEPLGAASLTESLKQEKLVTLSNIDKFVDGAAVQTIGSYTFDVAKEYVNDVVTVEKGHICKTILELYNQHAIVAEPAGAMAICALDSYKSVIVGKNVVCVISGGNNDISRMPEIKELSLIFEGLLHYFIIQFPQRAGALKEFLDKVLGPNDNIVTFQYTKKNNKEYGPVLLGIELGHKDNYSSLINNIKTTNFAYKEINKDNTLFEMFV